MNAKLIELAKRRATLAAKAATQRAELSQALALWRAPLTVVDQGLAAGQYIRKHAVLLLAVAAVARPLRALRVVKWLRRGLLAWRAAVAAKRILLGL